MDLYADRHKKQAFRHVLHSGFSLMKQVLGHSSHSNFSLDNVCASTLLIGSQIVLLKPTN